AGPDRPHLHLPDGHRVVPRLRPGVGDHQGRAHRRDPDDGHLPHRLRIRPRPLRIRRRGVDSHLRHIDGSGAALPTVRAAPRCRRSSHLMAVATVPARRILSRTVVYAVALAVLALILVPLVYAVLGGFRTAGQLAEHPVGLPVPWIFPTYLGTLRSPAFWRQVGNGAFVAPPTTFRIP